MKKGQQLSVLRGSQPMLIEELPNESIYTRGDEPPPESFERMRDMISEALQRKLELKSKKKRAESKVEQPSAPLEGRASSRSPTSSNNGTGSKNFIRKNMRKVIFDMKPPPQGKDNSSDQHSQG